MSLEVISKDLFEEWTYHPITRKLMSLLKNDREQMKEGLVSNLFENEEEVKGRCKAIAILLNLEYEDLAESH